jgi:hypothetical protein
VGAVLEGVDARRLLNECERQWHSLLQGVSLVAEADILPELSHQSAAALGRVYRSHLGESLDGKTRALSRWPSCVAVSLAGVAATDYDAGAFWPALWEIAGYEGNPQDQKIWGSAFTQAVERLGMPTFPGTHHRFLTPILMHAGVPSHCLGDLLRLLLEHSRRDPGLDADSFMLWAMNGDSRLHTVGKPVQRFLLGGGDYAYDTLDRMLDLLVRLRDPDPDLFGVGLPERIIEEARSLARRRLLDLSTLRGRTGHGARPVRVRLALDPFGEGPLIALPPSDGSGREWWIVIDGERRTVQAESAWAGEDDGEGPTFPLPRPVRNVQVSLGRIGQPVDLPVVDATDPLLVFTEDGRQLPSTRSLPPDVVWLLHRTDRRLSYKGDLPPGIEPQLPFGWEEWSLREANLAHVTEIGLAGRPMRKVRGTGQPRLLTGDPLPGITGAHGMPVYATAPTISLPDGTGKARWWHIHVREASATEPLTRLTATDGQIDPWKGLARPVVGEYEVIVLGPLGYRMHRQITVTEGLSVSYDPDIRLLTRGGLVPSNARLHAPEPVHPPALDFDEQSREQTVTYGRLRLRVAPPHLQVLRDDGSGGARWRSAPLSLTTESFDRPGALLVRGPASLRLSDLQVECGQETIQTVAAVGPHRPGQARFELARIRDTVQARRALVLSLFADGRAMPVASIQPRGVATGAVQRHRRLDLLDYSPVPGLRLGVYPVYAPWLGATVLPVSTKGTVVLPADLAEAGPLRVLPLPEGSGEWPYWPDEEESLRCAAAGAPDDPLARFVAGLSPLPDDPDLGQLWVLYELAERLEADGAREDLRAQCDMFFRNKPKAALLALADTRLSPDACLAEIIEVGLAGLRFREPVEPAETRRLWARLPAAATLLTGRSLARTDMLPDLMDVVLEQYDRGALGILLDGKDAYPIAAGGCAPVTEGHSAAQRSSKSGPEDPAGGVASPPSPEARGGRAPMSLLDPSRLRAPVGRLPAPLRDTEGLVTDAMAVLKTGPHAKAAELVSARPAGFPRLSLAFALIARVGAWAKARECSAFARDHRGGWAALARCAPDLVSIDLVLAEALMARAERSRPRGGNA